MSDRLALIVASINRGHQDIGTSRTSPAMAKAVKVGALQKELTLLY
jgi:hypothetical protein